MSVGGGYDAIVLAGGRGSRLGGVEKPLLVRDGRTLLAGVLDAVTDATRIVVVGPPSLAPHVAAHRLVREDPPLGGPVPAIAAGLDALPARDAPIMLLAADLVDPAPAVAALRAAHSWSAHSGSSHSGSSNRESSPSLDPEPVQPPASAGEMAPRPGPDGVIPVDPDRRRQPLLAIYRGDALRRAVADLTTRGTLDGLPLRRVIDALDLRELPLPADLLRDVDTATDAAEWDVAIRPSHPSP